jgi:hypothetical protein
MKTKREIIRIPLFSELKEPDNYDVYVYGTEQLEGKQQDTFTKALNRYLDYYGINVRELSLLSGLSNSGIYYYFSGKRHVTYDSLCAVCIALRLHPMRQKHLFCKSHLMMPADDPYPSTRDIILRSFLAACAFKEEYIVIACNDSLIEKGCKPISALTSAKEERTE